MNKSKYSVEKYKEKRNKEKTPEPTGDEASSSAGRPRFCIQKHDARNLHYDFRLEFDGVLKSWSIPKGFSTDPTVKRLAIRTEDHPVDYLDFEGVIPEGEYGAGKVLLWDLGTYKNITEKEGGIRELGKSIEQGHFLISLHGEKISGGYAMTRIDDKEGQWLLVKMKDDDADARRNPTSTEPESVKSGKKIEEIE